jgi:hypothetical protein
MMDATMIILGEMRAKFLHTKIYENVSIPWVMSDEIKNKCSSRKFSFTGVSVEFDGRSAMIRQLCLSHDNYGFSELREG